MTLICSFSYQGCPGDFADLLISSTIKSDLTVNIPASSDINQFIPKDSERYISGLKQKVCIPFDDIVILWSGSLLQARLFFDDFIKNCNSGMTSSDSLFKTLNEIEDKDKSDLALIGHIAEVDENDESKVKITNFHTDSYSYEFEGFTYAYAAGSGRESSYFLDIMDQIHTNNTMAEGTIIGDTGLVQGLLNVITSNMLGSELYIGSNLLEWWGGGYESCIWGGDKFIKNGNIFNLFWNIEQKENGKYIIKFNTYFVKQDYWQDLLIIRKIKLEPIVNQVGDENVLNIKVLENYANMILPVYKRPSDYDLSSFTLPDLDHNDLCVFITVTKNDNTVYHATWNFHDSNGVDLFKLKLLDGVCEISYKEELIKTIRSFVEDTFDINKNEWE